MYQFRKNAGAVIGAPRNGQLDPNLGANVTVVHVVNEAGEVQQHRGEPQERQVALQMAARVSELPLPVGRLVAGWRCDIVEVKKPHYVQVTLHNSARVRRTRGVFDCAHTRWLFSLMIEASYT